ncbi:MULTISPECIES: hypothetical protein [unclassified Streptomyces]|uniref:hypothetical protein n=1 Tax=Streptomyces sp. NPDC055082 TaxID=3365718 RepID=UPI0037CE031C
MQNLRVIWPPLADGDQPLDDLANLKRGHVGDVGARFQVDGVQHCVPMISAGTGSDSTRGEHGRLGDSLSGCRTCRDRRQAGKGMGKAIEQRPVTFVGLSGIRWDVYRCRS